MRNWPKYVLTAFVIVGALIGMAIIAPSFGMGQGAGAPAGILTGLVFSLMIPNLWKSFLTITNDDYEKAMIENHYLSFWDYIIQPTMLPFVIGILWFFSFLAFLTVFQINPSPEQSLIGFVPLAFSIGLCGFIMAKRKEFLTGSMYGYLIVRSCWAIFWGIFGMLFGWGTRSLSSRWLHLRR